MNHSSNLKAKAINVLEENRERVNQPQLRSDPSGFETQGQEILIFHLPVGNGLIVLKVLLQLLHSNPDSLLNTGEN
jgi:hypothetical protein